MELGEFVRESIKQLIDGIVEAQECAATKKAAINPLGLIRTEKRGFLVGSSSENPIPQEIDFDIAVSVTEGGEIKAGVGVFAGALGLGTQAKNQDSNTVANRIEFSVPIMFPRQEMPS